jgi:hypothetical protein
MAMTYQGGPSSRVLMIGRRCGAVEAVSLAALAS